MIEKMQRHIFGQKETRTANSEFKKLAAMYLNEYLCFVSGAVPADNFVRRNRQLLKLEIR